MASVLITARQESSDSSFSGTFPDEAPLVNFGHGGELHPTHWRLRVRRTSSFALGSAAAEDQVSIYLALIAPFGAASVEGDFFYPTMEGARAHTYGPAVVGLLSELPPELLMLIQEATDIKLAPKLHPQE
jgi:hypothetical protein